jgi:hypothetical protein
MEQRTFDREHPEIQAPVVINAKGAVDGKNEGQGTGKRA